MDQVMDQEVQDQSELFNPFPGLRPFNFEENYLFFGREQQIDDLTQQLSTRRFIAVVGSSGSGKSSLVTAGLLPNLYEGFMINAGSRWRVVTFRPGNDPIGNLARALSIPEVWESEDTVSSEVQVTISETVLRSSKNGLVDLLEQARLPEGENVLIIADQFEELFRFRENSDNTDATNDAQDFVRLLLTAKEQTAVPIYVILTMRSDFLGECAQFEGLPEAINEGQYLVPRLTRLQRQQAIEGPIAVGNAKISSALMQRLLNDVGNEPDYLPILQHALMRTWEHWTKTQEFDKPIDIKNYEAIGGMAQALSNHADEIYDELKIERFQKIAEILFKRITELGTDSREYRRPTTLEDICQVAKASPAEVTEVIDHFRGPGRSFLMPPRSTEIHRNTIIDISHESLMRVWDRLDTWVEEEADSARIYKRLAQTAQLHERGEAGLWSDPDLGIALSWEEETQPNKIWARRYDSHFDIAMDFLRSSEKEQESIKRRRLLGIFTILVVSAIFLALGVILFNRAETARKEAEDAQAEAFAAASIAATSQARAETSEMVALTAQAQADDDREAADAALKKAQKSRADRLGTDALSRISNPQLSLLLAIEAIRTDRTIEAETAFIQAYQATLQPVASTLNAGVTAFAFSPTEDSFATRDWYGTTQLWHWGEGIEIDELEPIDLPFELDERYGYYGTPTLDLVFTNDGKWLITASQDGTINIWDLSVESFPSHTLPNLIEEGPVMGLSVFENPQSPSTVKVATVYPYTNNVKVWDAKSENLTPLYQEDQNPLNVGGILALNGDTLATTGTNNEVFIYDLKNKNRKPYYFHKTTITILELSIDGTKIASASRDNMVRIWNTQGNNDDVIELEGFESAITELVFDKNGDKLATVSETGIIRIWDANSGDKVAELNGCTSPIENLAFSQDGTRIAASSEYITYLWDIEEASLIAKFADPAYYSVNSVSFSPQDQYMVTLNSNGNMRFWDIADIDVYPNFVESCYAFTDITFNKDGSILAATQDNGRIQLFDTQTHKSVGLLSGPTVNLTDLSFSHKNDLLVASSSDGNIRIWDLISISDTLTATLPITTELATLLGSSQGMNSVAFNSDDTLLAAGGEDGFVYIWELPENRSRISSTASKKLLGHVEAVNKIAFSPDGTILATASQDHTVELWNVADLEAIPVTLIAHEDEVYGVAFNPNGELLATSSFDGTVILWKISPDGDFVKAEQVATLLHGNPILEIAFNADGSLLATAMRDHTIRVWDVSAALSADNGETSTEKTILWGHESAVSAVAFHPSKNEIATASWDRTIRLVPEADWPTVSLEVLGCKQATRNLSLSEWREYLEGSEAGGNYKEICDLPKHPSVAEDLIRLGQIYARQGDDESAKKAFEDANGIDPNLQLNPDAEVLLAQIVFAALKGDAEIAIQELDAALDEYPDIADKANSEVAQILLENARIHLREGDIQTAQKNIEQVIGLGTTLSENDFAQTFASELFEYALQYSSEGNFDNTLLAINWAVEINPEFALDASQILWDLGLEYPDFAVTAIPRSIELDPERAKYSANELYNDAKTYYNDARNSEDNQLYVRASSILDLVASTDYQAEEITIGELATFYNDICWYGSLNGVAEEVITACENAIELSPENGWFFDSRGLARALTGNYEGAIEDFNFFITSYEEDSDYEGIISIRQSWIITLEAGANPFDEATLEGLRN